MKNSKWKLGAIKAKTTFGRNKPTGATLREIGGRLEFELVDERKSMKQRVNGSGTVKGKKRSKKREREGGRDKETEGLLVGVFF